MTNAMRDALILRNLDKNVEAEAAVLGCLLSPEVSAPDMADLAVEDFTLAEHGVVFEAAAGLTAENSPVDTITVRQRLKESGTLKEAGGEEGIMRLTEIVPSRTNLDHYAGILRRLTQQRVMFDLAGGILRDCTNVEVDVRERATEYMKNIALVASRERSEKTVGINAVLHKMMEDFDQRPEDRVDPLLTGYRGMDTLMPNGMSPGELIILAARPSMGKTTLALNVVAHVAGTLHRPVMFFSVEMEKEQLAVSMVVNEAGVSVGDYRAARRGLRSDECLGRIMAASARVSRWPLNIMDYPGLSVSDVVAELARPRREPPPALVVIDYLQLMKLPHGENQNLRVGSASRQLKNAARTYHVPILLLSQLNRACELTKSKRPCNADLRDSGSLEQDADKIWLMFRQDAYRAHGEPKDGVAEINVSKNRLGPQGGVGLSWEPECMRFSDGWRRADDA